MFGWLQKRKLAREWRLVATLSASYTDKKGEVSCRIFYYLKENGLGERVCEHDAHGAYSGESSFDIDQRVSHPYYLRKIKPWLLGAYDPEIPSFETIKAKEFKDALKGQKS